LTDSDAIDLQRRTSPKSPKTKREQIDAGVFCGVVCVLIGWWGFEVGLLTPRRQERQEAETAFGAAGANSDVGLALRAEEELQPLGAPGGLA
jgi:hypothetical protein